MNQDILALMIFYGGLSVFVAGGLLYGLWEWRVFSYRKLNDRTLTRSGS